MDLPSLSVTALRERKRKQLEERLQSGAVSEDHDLIFCTHQGRRVGWRNVLRAFKLILERSGSA